MVEVADPLAGLVVAEDAGAGGVDAGAEDVAGAHAVAVGEDVRHAGLGVARGGDAERQVGEVAPRLRGMDA